MQANDVDSVLNGFHFTERERFFEFYPEGKQGDAGAGAPAGPSWRMAIHMHAR